MLFISLQFFLDYGKLTSLAKEISANKNMATNWTKDGILEALRKKFAEQYAPLLVELKDTYCAEIFDTFTGLLDGNFGHIVPASQVLSPVNKTNGKRSLLIF